VDELTATILVMLRKCGDSALPNLVGRTFDLKSAYKQFGVDVEHQKTLRIAQRHPDGGVKFFAVQSLPFGATACVSSFLRIAASIKFIGTVGCGSFGPISLMTILLCVPGKRLKR